MLKHAYLIEAHTNFRILNSLITLLDDENNDFFVLIDKKVNKSFQELVTIHPQFSKIYEVPRIKISWASYSGIVAVFELLKAAISAGGGMITYILCREQIFQLRKRVKSLISLNKITGKSLFILIQLGINLANIR